MTATFIFIAGMIVGAVGFWFFSWREIRAGMEARRQHELMVAKARLLARKRKQGRET